MKALIALLVCLLISGFWYTVLFNRPCGGDYVGLRDNGADWFQFGPGLINSCNCAHISIRWPDDKEDNWIKITDPDKIAFIKKWVVANGPIDAVEGRMNFAPYWPDYLNEGNDRFGPSIVLYGSRTQDEIDAQSLIVAIPLVPLAFGTTQAKLDEKLAALKKDLQ